MTDSVKTWRRVAVRGMDARREEPHPHGKAKTEPSAARRSRSADGSPLSRPPWLGKDLGRDVTPDIRQAEITARVAIRQLLVIQSHRREQRRVEIVRVHPALDRLDAKLVGP